jgi:beta-lactamase class A
MAAPFSSSDLGTALRVAVLQALAAGPRFDPFPNIDLAVLALPRGAAPVAAQVLFSRDMPSGRVVDAAPGFGAVQGVRFLTDARGPDGTSLAWVAGTDWRQLPEATFAPLAGSGPQRFIAPYPASLVKLMVAVAVARLVDEGAAQWDEPWPHGSAVGALAPSVAQWCEPMVVASSNEATSALVALLHARGFIRRVGWVAGQRDSGQEVHNALHALFDAQGLATLRLANTKPDGGWLNGDGAGVGQLQMTAWDTVRLLWRLLADDAPPAPWLPADAPPLLGAASRARLWGWLRGQTLQVLLPAGAVADACFAHKTGGTASYAADAGLVVGDGGRRYLIALITTLGQRHAPPAGPAVAAALPHIGLAVDAWLKARLE